MKYFIDTEFYEKPGSISLISYAMVAEDGRELYRWNKGYDKEAERDKWLCENVFPFKPVYNSSTWIKPRNIGASIVQFIGNDTSPEFWGDYCAYDWVVLCWQFGRMVDLPNHFPMYCNDLQQLRKSLGNPALPQQPDGNHDALADARWLKAQYEILTEDVACSNCGNKGPFWEDRQCPECLERGI